MSAEGPEGPAAGTCFPPLLPVRTCLGLEGAFRPRGCRAPEGGAGEGGTRMSVDSERAGGGGRGRAAGRALSFGGARGALVDLCCDGGTRFRAGSSSSARAGGGVMGRARGGDGGRRWAPGARTGPKEVAVELKEAFMVAVMLKEAFMDPVLGVEGWRRGGTPRVWRWVEKKAFCGDDGGATVHISCQTFCSRTYHYCG